MYLSINNEIKKDMRKLKNDRWNKVLLKTRAYSKSFWKLVNKFKRKKSSIPISTDKLNNKIFMDRDKADCLVNYLASIHNDNDNNILEQSHINKFVNKFIKDSGENNYSDKFYTNYKELHTIIKKLPAKKAPGIVQINNKIIKNLPGCALNQLVTIINAQIKPCYFSGTWKTSQIVPI